MRQRDKTTVGKGLEFCNCAWRMPYKGHVASYWHFPIIESSLCLAKRSLILWSRARSSRNPTEITLQLTNEPTTVLQMLKEDTRLLGHQKSRRQHSVAQSLTEPFRAPAGARRSSGVPPMKKPEGTGPATFAAISEQHCFLMRRRPGASQHYLMSSCDVISLLRTPGS